MSELENIYLQSNTKYNNNYYIHLSAQKDGLTFGLRLPLGSIQFLQLF